MSIYSSVQQFAGGLGAVIAGVIVFRRQKKELLTLIYWAIWLLFRLYFLFSNGKNKADVAAKSTK